MKKIIAMQVAVTLSAAVGVAGVAASDPSDHKCPVGAAAAAYQNPETNANGLLACCPDSDKVLPCNTPYFRTGLSKLGNNWGSCDTRQNVRVGLNNTHSCVYL